VKKDTAKLKIMTKHLSQVIKIKLGRQEDNDGAKPVVLALIDEISNTLETQYTVHEIYDTKKPPKVLVFYSTMDNEDCEEDTQVNSFCQMFSNRNIYPSICRNATEEQVIMEITWAMENPDVSSLIVVVLSHSQAGQVKLADKVVALTSIVSVMSADPLSRKPKVCDKIKTK
jgi:hypothetical protein